VKELCYGLNASQLENLILKEIVLGSGAFGRLLGGKARVLMNGRIQ
jgi:hypothetical protein